MSVLQAARRPLRATSRGTFTALVCSLGMLASCAGAGPMPHVKWTFQTDSRIYSSPVVADFSDLPGLEILLVSSADRRLICLSAPAKTLWTYDGFLLRNTSTPTVADLDDDGKPEILIGSRKPGVVCLDSTGTRRWAQGVPDGLPWGSITVADLDRDGTPEVCWVTRTGLVECRRPDGGKLWDYQIAGNEPGSKTDASPTVGDVNGDGLDEIVAPGRHVVACLTPSGKEIWTAPSVSRFNGGPVIADVIADKRPEVLLGSEDGVLYCLEGTTGKTLWTHQTFNVPIGTAIAAGDIDNDGLREVVYGDQSGSLYCLDGTGTERWCFKAGDWIEGAPALGDVDGDGRIEIIFGSADGNVYCLSPAGAKKWTFPTGSRVSASPTLCDVDNDGVVEILVPSHNGKLYCLSCGGRWDPATMPWPFKRHDVGHTGCLPSN
jgi:outer membrane protein assembly factor BamB